MSFLLARADDNRWRRFADVIVEGRPQAEAVVFATTVLGDLPGCALVAVADDRGGCVLAARGQPIVRVAAPVDVERCAVLFYSALVSGSAASFAPTSAPRGSSTCS